jgi:hypothetical protein
VRPCLRKQYIVELFKKYYSSQAWWHRTVIPATQEAEARGVLEPSKYSE